MREAMHYTMMNDRALCQICPNKCIIKEGETGICGTRLHDGHKLYALSYGQVTSFQIDPIEKKPLACWFPGTEIFSIGSFGCNLRCPYCQNHEISMGSPRKISLTPEALVAQCESYDLPAIAYTYNEPTVNYEYVYDTAILAKKKDLKNVLVTNGYINELPLKNLLPYIDAMNIDVKAFTNSKMMEVCGGRLDHVLKTIDIASQSCHVELTMLIVPTVNDDPEELEAFASMLRKRVGDLPLHLSRYFPRYKFDQAATDIDLLVDMQKRARKYFTHVYLGNVGV